MVASIKNHGVSLMLFIEIRIPNAKKIKIISGRIIAASPSAFIPVSGFLFSFLLMKKNNAKTTATYENIHTTIEIKFIFLASSIIAIEGTDMTIMRKKFLVI
jgi:hypothetical protein